MVERTENDRTWSARVEAPDQVYQSVFGYPTMIEAQAWVEQKIETLLSTPHTTLTLPPPHHHPNPTFGPERDQRLRLNRLSWHKVKSHALDERSQDQLRFHHGNMIADADVWPSTEREIGIARIPLACQHEDEDRRTPKAIDPASNNVWQRVVFDRQSGKTYRQTEEH